MKKGEFKITVMTFTGKDYEKVSGLISENFGIYKDNEKKHYCVTHLKTGAKASLSFARQKDAKAFVSEAENIPGIETMNLNNTQDFRDQLQEITWRIIKNT